MIVVAASIALFASVTSTAAQTGERMGAVDEEGIVDEGDDGVDGPVDSTPTQTCVEEGENLGTLTLGATVERSGELSDGDCRDTPISWWGSDRWVDRFAFELNERGSIRIDLVDTGTASGSFDPFLVLNQGSQYVAENNDGGSSTNARLQFELDTGSYQIVVTNWRTGDVSAKYRLTVSLVAPCEPERLDLVEDMSSAALTRTGEFAASGCIVSTRHQTYSPGAVYLFGLADPRSVRIDLQGLDGVNSYLRLEDEVQGWTMGIDDDAGPGRDALIRRNLRAGEYRIQAGSVSDNEGTGRYRLTLTVDAAPSCDEDQLGLVHGTIVRSGEFGVGGCITERWNSWYWSAVHVFSLAERGRIQIDLDGIDGVDPMLWLTDEQGNQVAQDLDGGAGRGARIERELAAGTYRISAQRASGYNRGEGGRYQLTIDATSQPAPPSRDAGRIVVRRLADGRTEFGWLPKDADAADRILPDRRHLEATAEAEVGRWISSGPVEVAGVIIGWINIQPLADGRVELGFTTTNGERILPRGRWLPANPPTNRWLRSSEIELSASTE